MNTTPPSFSVRSAGEADFSFLWRLIVTTMRDYVSASSEWNETWQYDLFRKRFDPEAWLVISVPDDVPVGGLAVETRAVDIVLTDIYILPPFQMLGIGTSLITKMMANATACGKVLTLLVLKDNPRARSLYERLGMHVIGERGFQYVMASDPLARIEAQ